MLKALRIACFEAADAYGSTEGYFHGRDAAHRLYRQKGLPYDEQGAALVEVLLKGDPNLIELGQNVWCLDMLLWTWWRLTARIRRKNLARPHRLTEVVASLIEVTVFTRNEWAEVLGTSTTDIDRWVAGKALPSPSELQRLVEATRSTARSPDALAKALANFEALLDLPAAEITGFAIGNTLGDYLLEPLVVSLRRVLKSVPFHMRETAMLDAAAVCRRYRGSDSV